MSLKDKAIELFGWYGTGAIVIAYVLSNFQILKISDLPYQFLNLSGALGIIFSSLVKKNYQSVVLNFVWFLVALIALIQIIAANLNLLQS